jgi:hypothetical protein
MNRDFVASLHYFRNCYLVANLEEGTIIVEVLGVGESVLRVRNNFDYTTCVVQIHDFGFLSLAWILSLDACRELADAFQIQLGWNILCEGSCFALRHCHLLPVVPFHTPSPIFAQLKLSLRVRTWKRAEEKNEKY